MQLSLLLIFLIPLSCKLIEWIVPDEKHPIQLGTSVSLFFFYNYPLKKQKPLLTTSEFMEQYDFYVDRRWPFPDRKVYPKQKDAVVLKPGYFTLSKIDLGLNQDEFGNQGLSQPVYQFLIKRLSIKKSMKSINNIPQFIYRLTINIPNSLWAIGKHSLKVSIKQKKLFNRFNIGIHVQLSKTPEMPILKPKEKEEIARDIWQKMKYTGQRAEYWCRKGKQGLEFCQQAKKQYQQYKEKSQQLKHGQL